MDSSSQGTSDSPLPDWSKLDVELNCPRCGYDLRLLTRPRCPECGLPFNWQDLAAAERLRRDNPLFEYQWRYRPIRSLLGTIARTLYPPWVWGSVRLEVAPRIGPLLVLALVVGISSMAVGWSVRYGELYYFNRFIPIPVLPPVLASAALQASLGAAIWLTLLVFWQTRARGHLRQAHVLRIVVFAWTGSVIWKQLIQAMSTGLAIGYWDVTGRMLALDWSYFPWCWRLAEWIGLGTLAWSLCLGLSRYLRVRRGVPIVLLTLLVVLFALFVSIVASAVYIYDTLNSPLVSAVKTTWPETAALLEQIVVWIFQN